MNITFTKTQIHTLKPGDPNFTITDQFVITPRASLEISSNCPYNHLQIIQTCIDRGWLKPVAHVTERELLFMGLTKE
jgi:hypothetical protein